MNRRRSLILALVLCCALPLPAAAHLADGIAAPPFDALLPAKMQLDTVAVPLLYNAPPMPPPPYCATVQVLPENRQFSMVIDWLVRLAMAPPAVELVLF